VEGEAYFDIKHNEKKPFIVKTATASIRVLGTAFNVRSYTDLDDIQVTVARGKVAVNETTASGASRNKEVLLVRNEQVSINKQSGNLQKSRIASENITGWTEGKLIFNNESLANIGSTLKHTRNFTVRFAEPDIALIRCSAGFDSTDSIEDIISALSRANGLNYSIKKSEVLLTKK
jgi:ferric-dicitrate binding protein FerR (iron transport regulator)